MADDNTELTTATSPEAGEATPSPRTTPVQSARPSLEDTLAAELEAPVSKPTKAKPHQPAKAEAEEEDPDDEEEEDDTDPESEVTETDDSEGEANEEEAEEGEDEAEEETTEEEDPKAKDETPGRNGLKDLPKWAQDRVSKQSADIRRLRSELASALATTPATSAANPLGHVTTLDALQQEIDAAKAVRAQFGKLRDSDYEEAADGTATYTYQQGNQVFKFTKAEIEQKLQLAESRLDLDAIRNRERYLAARATSKPWEKAEAICPGLLEQGSRENAVVEYVLKQCPQVAQLPDWEVLLAHAARSLRQEAEMQPSKDYPKGKIKVVTYSLDKAGKIVTPTRSGAAKTGTPKPKPEAAPSGARPQQQPPGHRSSGRPDAAAAVARHAISRSDESLRDVLMADLA